MFTDKQNISFSAIGLQTRLVPTLFKQVLKTSAPYFSVDRLESMDTKFLCRFDIVCAIIDKHSLVGIKPLLCQHGLKDLASRLHASLLKTEILMLTRNEIVETMSSAIKFIGMEPAGDEWVGIRKKRNLVTHGLEFQKLVKVGLFHFGHKAEPAPLTVLPTHFTADVPTHLLPELFITNVSRFHVADKTFLRVCIKVLFYIFETYGLKGFDTSLQRDLNKNTAKVKNQIFYLPH